MKFITSGELEQKSMSELISIYNQISDTPTKRFASHATGVRRILLLLSRLPAPTERMPATLTIEEPKKPVRKVVTTADPKGFDLPPDPRTVAPRPNTKRAKLLALLLEKGASRDEVARKFGWDKRTAYEGIKLLNLRLGYGLREKDGIIRAFAE